MSLSRLTPFLILAVMASLPATAFAQWQVNNAGSTLSFVTVKNDHVAEAHTFDRLSGTLAADGSLSVTVELASINTLIPIRDERMQNLLFETGLFPRAQVSAKLDMGALNALAVGQSMTTTVNFDLDLHGRSNPLSADLTVIREANGFLATTRKPVLVSAEAFNLTGGIEALREVAGLTRIGYTVPVQFVIQVAR